LWPAHSADFPSSSLTEADAKILRAALDQIAVSYGANGVATKTTLTKDFAAVAATATAEQPAADAPKEVVCGTVSCTLLRAANLLEADMFSPSDVYCKLWLSDQQNEEGGEEAQEQRSRTIDDSNNPEWGDMFSFRVGNVNDCTLR